MSSDAAAQPSEMEAGPSAPEGGSNGLDARSADAAAAEDGSQQRDAEVDGSAELPDGGSDSGPVDTISTDGLVLWLRADRGVVAETGSVSTWADQSPAHQDPSQPILSQRPAYRAADPSSGPAIVFDGVDDVLVLPGGFDDFSTGLTILVVVRHRATTGDYVPYFECSNGPEIDDLSLGRYLGELHFESDDQTLNSSSVADEVVQQFSALLRPTQELSLRRNGIAVGARVFGQTPRVVRRENVFVGGSLYADSVRFAGDIHELIIYRRALESTELLALENSLRTRWTCCSP